ncbi:MAG: biotin/lipoyl-binding protein, partial [Proteobacteria bacterium]|nr:biotin/lipoyl-binding protein [Pseudomonadota bacterium]
MKRIRYRYLVLPALLATAVAGLFVFRTVAPLGVQVAGPIDKIDIMVFGLGTIEARVVSMVGFEVSGTLTLLDADHGDAVVKGDALAQLDDGEQAARVARAEAGVESAVAAVKAVESVVAKARAVLVQRQQNDSRIQTLFARQTVSAEAADEARMQKKSAEAELGVALSNVEVARAGLGEARAQYRFDRIILDQHVLYAPYDAVVFERSK